MSRRSRLSLRPALEVRPPVPPGELPAGGVRMLPGRGEVFYRDSGGDGVPVLLLHGWTVSADMNWHSSYAPLQDAGYRVIAIDHRGHGRGMRSPEPFRLEDCAEDAAALLLELGTGPALVVGYSMGGAIAQLMARAYPELTAGLVLGGTASDWADPTTRVLWAAMGGFRLLLNGFPNAFWRLGVRQFGLPPAIGIWYAAELSRSSARDIAEAGRELGRFDSRPWLGELSMPRTVIVPTRDEQVAPRKQHALAATLGASVHEFDGSHNSAAGPRFAPALLAALAEVSAQAPEPTLVRAHES